MHQFGPVRVQTVQNTVTKDKVVTVVREVTKPDGTVTRDERTERDSAQTVVTPISQPRPNWLVGVSASPSIPNKYGAFVGRRVLGNVFITVSATTHGDLLAGLLIEF